MNIPNCFEDSTNILFAGVGGGFDIFGAIPIAVTLRENPKYNFVFSNYNGNATKFTCTESIYPESKLIEVIDNQFAPGEPRIPIYSLPKVGVKAYEKMYAEIIKNHNIDTIVAIDGGVDSLMRGDEDGAGTILEDFVNLIALDQMKLKSILVCSGFGTEMEEEICHHHVLENIAQLISQNAFLGSCSLVKDSEAYKYYKHICELVWIHGRKSHIHSKVLSASMGLFGDKNYYSGVEANVMGSQGNKNYLSPLMSIYWFFNLAGVMKNNLLYSRLLNTNTKTDALMMFRQSIDEIVRRPRKGIPY